MLTEKDLKEQLEAREQLQIRLQEVQQEKTILEGRIAENLIEIGMFECLTVNWRRVNRVLRNK